MELNKIAEGVFELIDLASSSVITRGSFDHCLNWMCELERLEERSAWLANEI